MVYFLNTVIFMAPSIMLVLAPNGIEMKSE